MGFVSETADPNQPFEEDDYIEEWAKDPIMGELPVFWFVNENDT